MRLAIFSPLLLLACAWAPSSRAATEDDAAMFKACPGLQAWEIAHPHAAHDAKTPAPGKQQAISAPQLLAQLQQRVAEDQRVREATFTSGAAPSREVVKALMAVDADNLQWLRKTIDESGFPTLQQVGEEGVSAAFTLVQHADADPVFQESVLEAVRPRLATAGIAKANFAMLTDRVLTAQGKPQRYGSQYDRAADGSFTLKPTEDLPGLDERREQMDLVPSKFYECVLRFSYGTQ